VVALPLTARRGRMFAHPRLSRPFYKNKNVMLRVGKHLGRFIGLLTQRFERDASLGAA
jgi:hypothetical protein